MAMRSVSVLMVLLCLGFTQPGWAGYYSSIDTLEETRWSLDYENVFADVLAKLRTISDPNPKVDHPMRRRYIFIETAVRDNKLPLDTLAQKIDYSTVLIRRGRVIEAANFLRPLADENPDNFLVLSQYGTALFLTNTREFEVNAPAYMKDALKKWPEKWTQVNDEQKKFLSAFGWEETAFERFRRYEELFSRLIAKRVKEKGLLEKNVAVPEAVDPIFLDAQNKPIRFVNENGGFEAGRILAADKEQLPRDCVHAVEQLLIWMPHDKRLLWLLGETFNATAMEYKSPKELKQKNQMIRSAFRIFDNLNDPLNRMKYGTRDIVSRYESLKQAVEAMPPENVFEFPLDDPKDESTIPWRVIAVSAITGFFVGLFALWQIQEMRRRRQARSAPR